MDIIVRSILGHVQGSDGSVTLFVDAEVEGTISAQCRLRFPEPVAVPALKVIIEDGIHALRRRHFGLGTRDAGLRLQRHVRRSSRSPGPQ